jgi:triacylglycerol esterase/lipase EstA (alpha/beta hydrolase family)
MRPSLLATPLATVAILIVLASPCRAASGYVTGGPNSGHSTVIIFIHGYLGSNESWMSKTGQVSLPKLIGTDPDLAKFVDVYLFEYATEKMNGQALLPGSIANELRQVISTMAQTNKSSVVLVGHSMGGLVAWSVIDEMQTIQMVTKIIKMVFTFSTPFEGTSLTPAAFTALISPNKQIYALLQIGKNPFLDQLKNKHDNSTTQQHIHTYCAYETAPMPHFGIVVSKKSATAFCNTTRQFRIDADHQQVVKPEPPGFPTNFDSLKSAILDSAKSWNQLKPTP